MNRNAEPRDTIGLAKRKLSRLPDYDYTQAGWYFVTICTWNHECLLGTLSEGEVQLNHMGQTAAACWRQIPEHFPRVSCDVFCVMPNHLHGIIVLPAEDPSTGQSNNTSLSVVVGTFKAAVSRQCATRGVRTNQRLWQRSYFERVIRTEENLTRIRQYIVDNPVKWDLDEENPQNRTLPARPGEEPTRLQSPCKHHSDCGRDVSRPYDNTTIGG